MTAPQYDKNHIFNPVGVVTEEKCFWCPIHINPTLDTWMIAITIPGKSLTIMHPECFEQMAWTMLNYVHANQAEVEPKGLIN